jgi:hypothetical protein
LNGVPHDGQVSALTRTLGASGSSLFGEAVEFTVLRSAQERVPFAGREPQNRALAMLAVADPDVAVWEARYLDAIAIGKAPRAFDPVRIRLGYSAPV